jgi:hypothetical protein
MARRKPREYLIVTAPKKGDGQARYQLLALDEDDARAQVERTEANMFGAGQRDAPYEVVLVEQANT